MDPASKTYTQTETDPFLEPTERRAPVHQRPYIYCHREREGEGERERASEREREGKKKRKKERKREREKERKRERDKERKREREKEIKREREKEKEVEWWRGAATSTYTIWKLQRKKERGW